MDARSWVVATTRAATAEVDPLKCTDCGQCIAVCPRSAIRKPSEFCCAKCVKYCLAMEVSCSPVSVSICPDLCDGCGLCVPICPEGAIAMRERESER